ncbi:MAG: hypothetical protein ACI9B7_000263 [Oleispira sp.]|jgi:hypothetical protein
MRLCWIDNKNAAQAAFFVSTLLTTSSVIVYVYDTVHGYMALTERAE